MPRPASCAPLPPAAAAALTAFGLCLPAAPARPAGAPAPAAVAGTLTLTWPIPGTVILGQSLTVRGTASGRLGAPGRPGWTQELFWTRYRDALGRAEPPHTNASIAAHLEMLDGELGTEPDYLRKLVKRFGLPPA